MKTASIITMHFPLNYGAVLQTYALYAYLQSLGLKTSIIDYKPFYLIRYQSLTYVGDVRLKKYFITRWLYIIIKAPKRIRRKIKFYNFINCELVLTKKCRTYNEIVNQNFDFDFCFCGSDQIWNEINETCEDPSYFLYFAKGKSILISYAASGNLSCPLKEKVKDTVIPMINDLDYISMREEVTIRNIQPYVEKPISYVCDPVFLLSFEQWISLMMHDKNIKLKKKYVLVYPMGNNPQHVIANAYSVAKYYHLPLYCISSTQKKDSRIDRFFDVSPYDFLNLILNASFVVTNSFHGTAFSIIMKKIFWSCEIEGTNQRISSLLNKIGLSSRSVPFDCNIDPNSIYIDYVLVEEKLRFFIDQSKGFIKNSIGYNKWQAL